MATTWMRRETVRQDLARVLTGRRQQDGGNASWGAYWISQDNKGATAEMLLAVQRVPAAGLMRAGDYLAVLADLQVARVHWRRAGKRGDPSITDAALAWQDRAQRVAAFPFRDLLERVGELTPAGAIITGATHDRILEVVETLWDYGVNGGSDVY